MALSLSIMLLMNLTGTKTQQMDSVMHKSKVRSVLMQAVEPSAKPEGDWN